MINQKTKKFTWTSFAYALVLILLASTMVGIVAYAAGSKTHNIGGNVTFSADGIEATIGAGSTSGGSTTKQSGDVMQEIIFSTTQSEDTYDKNSSTWSDLEVTIDAPTDGSSTATATISFVVTNNLESDYLAVSLKSLDAGEATPTGSISVATSVDSVPTYIGYESGSNTATISITFTVADADYNAEISGFSVELKLAKAETLSSNSITYALNSSSNAATVISYDGDGGEVTVEDTISVEEAAAESVSATASEQKVAAFANATDAEENQTISAQSTSYLVTAIAANAFSGTNCSSITSLTLSSNLTAIGASAFTGCSNITSITIPSGVTSIGAGVFYGCTSLTSIKDKSELITDDLKTYFGVGTGVEITNTSFYSVTLSNVWFYVVEGGTEWIATDDGYNTATVTIDVEEGSSIIIGYGHMESWGYNNSYIDWTMSENVITHLYTHEEPLIGNLCEETATLSVYNGETLIDSKTNSDAGEWATNIIYGILIKVDSNTTLSFALTYA